MSKNKNIYPLPPYSYDGIIPPEYALVGKPVLNSEGGIVTFHLVLENTKTGKPATPEQMKAFHQAIITKFTSIKD